MNPQIQAKPRLTQPDLSNTDKYQFIDANGLRVPFDKLPQYNKNKVYDDLLQEQGFATHTYHYLKKSIMVADIDGKYNDFTAEYSRVGANEIPHFSTTYKGQNAQEDMNHNDPLYAFYRKWQVFHGNILTAEEWTEMSKDLNEALHADPKN